MQASALSGTERDQFIESNLPLVRHVQRRMSFTGGVGISDRDDIYSDGVLGLIEAVDRFDPVRNSSFAAYARSRIRGAMLDGLRRMDALSRDSRSSSARIEQSRAALRISLEREPTRSELLRASGLSKQKFDAVLFAASVHPIPLDTYEPETGPGLEVRDHSLPEHSADLEYAELHSALVRAIELLPQREKLAISLYYHEGLRVREVSDVLGVSPSRASQLIGQALRRLRANEGLGQAA